MVSTFGEKLKYNTFLVTAEITPLKGTDTSAALADAMILRGWTDALNITDNQRSFTFFKSKIIQKFSLIYTYKKIVIYLRLILLGGSYDASYKVCYIMCFDNNFNVSFLYWVCN